MAIYKVLPEQYYNHTYSNYTLPRMTSQTAPEGQVFTNFVFGTYSTNLYGLYWNNGGEWYIDCNANKGVNKYLSYKFKAPLKKDTYTLSGYMKTQNNVTTSRYEWTVIYEDGVYEIVKVLGALPKTNTSSSWPSGSYFSVTFEARKRIAAIELKIPTVAVSSDSYICLFVKSLNLTAANGLKITTGSVETNSSYYDKDNKVNNVSVIGSPYISTHLVGHFTDSNYLRLPDNLNVGTSDYEAVVKFYFNGVIPRAYMDLLAFNYRLALTVAQNSAGTAELHCNAGDGSAWGYNQNGSTVLTKGDYYIKVARVSGIKTLYMSRDGKTWSKENSGADNVNMGSFMPYMGARPDVNGNITNTFNGSIDLSGCYFKINGNVVWEGTKTAVKQIKDVYVGSINSNTVIKAPNNINLVLNPKANGGDGSVTLKAGSVIYDGAGNAYEIKKDLTQICKTSINGPVWMHVNLKRLTSGEENPYNWASKTDCYSGPTQPAVSMWHWWNTTNNKITASNNDGGELSLPIAALRANGSEFINIYSDFDFFGYLGQRQYVLPGVICFIPNGLDSQGNYKVKEYTTPHIIYRDIGYMTSGQTVFLRDNNTLESSTTSAKYYKQANEPAKTIHAFWWNTKDNLMRRCYQDASGNLYWQVVPECEFGAFTSGSDQRITGITIPTVQPAAKARKIARVYKESTLVYRSQVDWETPNITSLSQNGYRLEASTTTNLNTLFQHNSAPKYRWGQGVSSKTKWFRITFPFKVKVTAINVYQGFAGSNNDSRCYNVRFYAAAGASNPISNQITLNWNVSSETKIPLTAWPETNVVYCACNMQQYGTLSAVRMWGIRYDV